MCLIGQNDEPALWSSFKKIKRNPLAVAEELKDFVAKISPVQNLVSIDPQLSQTVERSKARLVYPKLTGKRFARLYAPLTGSESAFRYLL